MKPDIELSNAEARRVVLAAQGFGRPRAMERPGSGHVRQLAQDLGAVQIDAVNVLVRSHYLPFFSRLGPYDIRLVDDLAYSEHVLFEYWGHAASLLPVELYPAMRWRMNRYAENKHWAAFQSRVEKERPGYLASIEREIAERGPLAYTDLTDKAKRAKTPTKYAESSLLWYRWSDGKSALEGLYDAGRLAVADRRGFERRYDLPERVIPAHVLKAPAPEESDAQRLLVLAAAKALGVGAVRDIADYFRLPVADTRARLRELIDEGALQTAKVADWKQVAYVHKTATTTLVRSRALLSPFDSLIWERSRTEQLYGFRHLFELYVKPADRRYGYYVLPFLLGDEIVGRVDLKAERKTSRLSVLGAYSEPGWHGPAICAELAAELHDLAGWLGLAAVAVGDRGDLASDLRKACLSTA